MRSINRLFESTYESTHRTGLSGRRVESNKRDTDRVIVVAGVKLEVSHSDIHTNLPRSVGGIWLVRAWEQGVDVRLISKKR